MTVGKLIEMEADVAKNTFPVLRPESRISLSATLLWGLVVIVFAFGVNWMAMKSDTLLLKQRVEAVNDASIEHDKVQDERTERIVRFFKEALDKNNEATAKTNDILMKILLENRRGNDASAKRNSGDAD
jgi:hypothetical protein